MKIFIGADHAGFGLKENLINFLASLGHEVVDKGAFEYNEEDDFPDFVSKVAKEVSSRPEEVRGIILGGSGQGEAMCANRFKHVRASVYYGNAHSLVEGAQTILELSREHNNGNVLSLGARFITPDDAQEAVRTWLEIPFSGDERHQRRIIKMDTIHE